MIPGQEDPLEKGMATHSSILPGESHGVRSPVGYSPWDCKELDMTEQLINTDLNPIFLISVSMVLSDIFS